MREAGASGTGREALSHGGVWLRQVRLASKSHGGRVEGGPGRWHASRIRFLLKVYIIERAHTT